MTFLQILSFILYLAFIAFVVSKTDLRKIIDNKKWQHIVFGSITMVFILWLFRVSIHDGLVIHFLWLTTLTLVLGFRWAILAGTVVLFVVTFIGNESWNMLGVNGLLGVALPIVITYSIFAFTFHKIQRQLFVYIFVCAFFPGAITIAAKMLALSGYFYIDGFFTWEIIESKYAYMTWLMIFPEAFFNGFTMTCLIVYKPDLVYTFDDKFYIDGK